MNKFVKVLLVFSMTLAISQGCSTWLSQSLDISTLQSSTAASGINFCKNIKDATTCCSAEVVNGFQTKASELLARLTASVTTRDRMIIQARKTAFGLRGALARIQASSAQAAINLQNYSPVSSGTSNSGEISFDVSDLAGMASGFGEISTFLSGNVTDLVGSFDTFQEQRKLCIEELVNVQTAAWCLACHPDPTNNGLGVSTLDLHAELAQKLVGSCAPFIVESAAQNAFIGVHFMAGMLNAMANAMEKFAANNIEGGMNDLMGAIVSMIQNAAAYQPSSIDQAPATLPNGCTESSCSWITSSLFLNGKINEQYLAAGGNVEDPANSSGGFSFNRLLAGSSDDDDEEVVVVGRKLQTGTWNPPEDESGITISFEANPARVVNDENSLSGLRNAVVGLSLAVLAVLFF